MTIHQGGIDGVRADIEALVSESWCKGPEFHVVPKTIASCWRRIGDPRAQKKTDGRDMSVPCAFVLGFLPAMRPPMPIKDLKLVDLDRDHSLVKMAQYEHWKFHQAVRIGDRIYLEERCRSVVLTEQGYRLTYEHRVAIANSGLLALESRVRWWYVSAT